MASDTANRALEAAWQLLGNGEYPSAQTVRETIGQGSMTTINTALRTQFWPAVGQRIKTPGVPDGLAEALQQLWQRALEAADDALGEHRREVDERLATAELERQLVLDQLTNAQRELAARVEQLNDVQTRAQADREALTAALEAERTTSGRLQKSLIETEEARKTAALSLTQTTERLQAELAIEKQRSDDTEVRLTRLYDDQKSARQRLERQLEQQTKEHGETVMRLEGQIDASRSALSTSRDECRDLKAALAERTGALDIATVRRTQLDAEIERLAERCATQEAALADAHRGLNEQQQRLENAISVRAAAERENEVLARQIDALAERLANLGNPAKSSNRESSPSGAKKSPGKRR